MTLFLHVDLGCPACLHYLLILSVQLVQCRLYHPERGARHLCNALLLLKLKINWLFRTNTHSWAFLACWAFRSPPSSWTLSRNQIHTNSHQITNYCRGVLNWDHVIDFLQHSFDVKLPIYCNQTCQSQCSRQSDKHSQSVNQSTSSPSRPVRPSGPGAPLDPWKLP